MEHFIWYLHSKDVFRSALYIILTRLINGDNYLTEDYLLNKGWVIDHEGFYYELGIKETHRIYIKFSSNKTGYMVYLTDKKVYLTYESKIEWFELFYLLQHPDNGRYNILDNNI